MAITESPRTDVPGSLPTPVVTPITDEVGYAEELIRRLCDEFPPRRAATAAELDAQRWVAAEYARLGIESRLAPFTFNDNLYAVLALHFGIGTLGSAVSGRKPLLGAALHTLAGGSYWLDSTRKAEILRRAFPYRRSQNLLATLPAQGTPKLRLVFLTHIDAAYTGLLFNPKFVKVFAHKGTNPPYPARSLAAATHAELAAGAVSLLRAAVGPERGRRLRQAEALLAIPGVLSFLLNFDVVRRNQTVPGAADNLTGVAGNLVLANRLLADRHPDVEYVFVTTGAEEAGTGGARRLATQMRDEWSTENTVVFALDTLSNGEVFYVEEGEVAFVPLKPWLEGVLRSTAESAPRFAGIRRFRIPVGSSDALPFAYAGYDSAAIACVDLAQGSPRHYHYVTDTPDNLDFATFAQAVDYTEAVVRNVVDARVAGAGR